MGPQPEADRTKNKRKKEEEREQESGIPEGILGEKEESTASWIPKSRGVHRDAGRFFRNRLLNLIIKSISIPTRNLICGFSSRYEKN